MTKQLTIAGVKAELKPLGVTMRRSGVPGELLVRVKGTAPGEGYFTDDLEDALATGKAMASHRTFTRRFVFPAVEGGAK